MKPNCCDAPISYSRVDKVCMRRSSAGITICMYFPAASNSPTSRRLAAIQEPADQASIPHPRIGFCGVIDERLDIDLLDGIAKLRPDYHFVMIGPVVKIDPATLPQHANIHYLGGKSYKELPAISGRMGCGNSALCA